MDIKLKVKCVFILLLYLMLWSVSAMAKKLYEYQDDQGRRKFTDRPPITEQRVFVKQLDVENKQRIRFVQSGDEQHPTFAIYNAYAGPVEAKISFSQQDNTRSTPELPAHFVVKTGQSAPLFKLAAVDNYQSWRFALTFDCVIGAPLKDYVAIQSYFPPIAPNTTFSISQAFNGAFTHTDVQSKYAVDIAMPIGTPIYAARAGIIMSVDNDFYKGGVEQKYATDANNIRILHDDGSMAIYAHLELEKVQVTLGQQVKLGQLIAYSGNTGFSSGPHLHFAIQYNKGMELVSVPFKFTTATGLAIEPTVGITITGLPTPNN